MARLNEPPVSSDSLETLRRKMLRQNRDLAKSNNIRALRIRELENECAGMLSENLELRGRILELEKQVEDSHAQRIADHALSIKEKLESQLAEWSNLVAGLGLEPPLKRYSPRRRRSTKPRLSCSASRPSPSQRRLRDVARDVEELGLISETKSYPRQSMNPGQILALQSEADSSDSPDLGPPPISQFIEEDPVKVDSPSRSATADIMTLSPARATEPPASFTSPHIEKAIESPRYSPEVPTLRILPSEDESQLGNSSDPTMQYAKAGSKRKLGARDNVENIPTHSRTDENQPFKITAERMSTRDKIDGSALRDSVISRKEGREKKVPISNSRKPLAAKSTNDDIRSPMKNPKTAAADKSTASKTDLTKPRPITSRSKPKTKIHPPTRAEESKPNLVATSVVDFESTAPLAEPTFLPPSSPEPIQCESAHRGDTPPPADISSTGETTRPSRRNRTAISYAEPNLRDKMRRPTKELFDAVAGEGKYARRSSQAGTPNSETFRVKRESSGGESWKTVADPSKEAPECDQPPPSPLAGKASLSHQLPNTVVTERRRRPSSIVKITGRPDEVTDQESGDQHGEADTTADTSGSGDVDIYEFTSSSPQTDNEEVVVTKKSARRQTISSRRASSTTDGDKGGELKDRKSARRRSMMV
ncbi:hypothetical protein HIM_03427 [Hirsutella minnesotensis 3608]|uniref:Shugoshin C-terminal domain-containing protein n=1 Tax=Hirsutella minnesotensis 3608 TaxID=1043627 RepID=A0A0F7ZMA9_9HYPO|nr:hypothetical protein HIM_03427 [Hirsutella minnesotensis 3608]